LSDYFQTTLKDVELKSLIKRCEDKEREGWEFVTQIKRVFMTNEGINIYKVVMRKRN
jgi:hypothetical protein